MSDIAETGGFSANKSFAPRAASAGGGRVRRPQLELNARLRLVADRAATTPVYRVTVCELNGRGAMVLADLPAGARLCLFEKVRYCLLDFDDTKFCGEQLLAKAVWIQPQTSAGDSMLVKVGLAFEGVHPDLARQLEQMAETG